MSYWNKSKKSGEENRVDTLYYKDWYSFWGIALRVLSFALVTVFLFLMISASCDSKERGKALVG